MGARVGMEVVGLAWPFHDCLGELGFDELSGSFLVTSRFIPAKEDKTMSAPSSRRRFWCVSFISRRCLPPEKPTQGMPAALAARTPWGESSITTQADGSTPICWAAYSNRSGAGLPRATCCALNTWAKRSKRPIASNAILIRMSVPLEAMQYTYPVGFDMGYDCFNGCPQEFFSRFVKRHVQTKRG